MAEQFYYNILMILYW